MLEGAQDSRPEQNETEGTRDEGRPPPKLSGIVGSPAQVAVSLSPAIHNAAFRAMEIDWLYLTFGLEPDTVVAGIRGLAAGGVKGMNVTLPHKVAALAAVDVLSESADRIGAVNTIEVRGGALVGWNTDGEGLVRFLTMDAGARVNGAHVLIIGAGGSARAAVFALGQAGARSIDIVSRDPAKAGVLESLAGPAEFATASLDQAAGDLTARSDIIINATPVGQAEAGPVIPAEYISPHAVVVDLVYRPPVTPLIRGARARGAVAHSGLGMLLHQAALASEIWTGVPPPMDVMSAAALAGLKQAVDAHGEAS